MRAKRTKVLKVRLSAEEYAQAKEKAESIDYRLAVLARELLLEKKFRARKKEVITAKMLAQIAYIGNNLNQIARAANTVKNFADIDLVLLNEQLLDIREQLSQVIESWSESDDG